MVRSLAPKFYRPAWPFIKKGSLGQRKIGPFTIEAHKWAGQNKEFPELSPKFLHSNPEQLWNYTGVQPTGYKDPRTGSFVNVPQMYPELVVPDLTGFELKPYVSYKTDVEIEKRRKAYEEKVIEKGSEEAADAITVESERWPPPKMDARTLFDLFYAEKVRDTYIGGIQAAKATGRQSAKAQTTSTGLTASEQKVEEIAEPRRMDAMQVTISQPKIEDRASDREQIFAIESTPCREGDDAGSSNSTQEDYERETEKRRQKAARNMKIGFYALLGVFGSGSLWFIWNNAWPKVDNEGNLIKEEFYDSWFAPLYRLRNALWFWKDFVAEPSRELLLPDPIPLPYHQPKYTVVIELKNILIHPEWSYSTGHRFLKRPALSYFLDVIGYPNFELVIYTSESSMVFGQVAVSLDPEQKKIMHKLFRDCTKYFNGHHVKDLSRLNRDLSKVIFIDFDPKSFQLNPENGLLVPAWNGNMDDTALVDLAELLKTIHLSDVDDVRPILQYYNQFPDPAAEFRRKAMLLGQASEQTAPSNEQSMLKRFSGRLFGAQRHQMA